MVFSFLEYLFLVIFTFLYYANDFIGGSTKAVHHSIKNSSRNTKAVFFKVPL